MSAKDGFSSAFPLPSYRGARGIRNSEPWHFSSSTNQSSLHQRIPTRSSTSIDGRWFPANSVMELSSQIQLITSVRQPPDPVGLRVICHRHPRKRDLGLHPTRTFSLRRVEIAFCSQNPLAGWLLLPCRCGECSS